MNGQVNYYEDIRNMQIKRGDIFYADLGQIMGSEQGGIRPVVIIQNNRGNLHSPTVIVAAITSQLNKAKLPTHTEIERMRENGLDSNSVILSEQVRTIDKRRLKSYIGRCSSNIIQKINQALMISIGLDIDDEELIPRRNKRNVFDITKVKMLVATINELEAIILNYGINESNYSIKNSIDMHISELMDYCEEYNTNYKLFYTPKRYSGEGVERRVISV